MSQRALLIGSLILAAAITLNGCQPTLIVLHHGIDWVQPGRRDFQLNVGAGALRDVPKSEIELALRRILAQEITRAGICPNGYEVTSFGGYEGGSTLTVEGRCLPANT
jgi:hypothetical protein